MKTDHSIIFRPAALQRYWQKQPTVALPYHLTEKIFFYLWLMLGACLLLFFLLLFVPIPTYISGYAVVSSWNDSRFSGALAYVIFLPYQSLAELEPGQSVFLYSDRSPSRLRRHLVLIETEIVTPDAARKRFGLAPAGTASLTAGPIAVAAAPFAPAANHPFRESDRDTLYRADVAVGPQRFISLLPFIGTLFSETAK